MCENEPCEFIMSNYDTVCIKCGLLKRKPVYTHDRNSSCKQCFPVYNRITRFIALINSYKVRLEINKEEILRLFTHIECNWACNKSSWNRKYFLNLRVLFYEIVLHLFEIDLYKLEPPLKDKYRVLAQRKIFKQLINNNIPPPKTMPEPETTPGDSVDIWSYF